MIGAEKKNTYRVVCAGEYYLLIDEEQGPIETASRFFQALESRGLSSRTIRAYAFDLLSLFRWMEQCGKTIEEITQSDLIEFVKEERKRDAHPNSINRRLLVCHLYYRFITDREIKPSPGTSLPALHYRGIGRDRCLGLHSMKNTSGRMLRVKVPHKLIEPLSSDQVKSFLRTLRRYRDLSIVFSMLLCGLRSREVLSLKLSSVVFEERRIRVHGKGNKERMLPLPPVLAASLQDYLRLERPRFCKNDALFVVMQGKQRGMPMTPSGLRSLFRHRRLNRVIADANPHRFRHTFGTDMARCGVGLPVLRELMGHANHETTLQYINLSMADITKEYESAVKQIERIYEDRQ
jgi:site-specific recombinase XerD